MGAIKKSYEIDGENMIEEPYFFENNGYKLFGIYHKPDSVKTDTGFVFCHPFLEEKLWTHRVYLNLARELRSLGYPVLRFDYMGHGDSEGKFEESDVETNISDIESAIIEFKKKSGLEKVCLMGLRYGAMLAAELAERTSLIDKLILWDPVIDGERFMQEILRTNLTTQMALHGKVIENREKLIERMKNGETVNVDGYEMNYSLFKQASLMKLKEKSLTFPGKVLIAQIGKEAQPLKKDLLAYTDKYKQGTLVKAVEEPFWREIRNYYSIAPNLYKETISWLENINE